MSPILGTWSQVASAEIVDMVGLAGFAFTIIDVEHGYFGIETAESMIRACDAARIEPWLRVPALDPVLIGKALDCGARRIVVPAIASAAQAAAAVAAGRYAPEGTRGACPCVRAGGHYIRDWRAHVARAHADTGIVLLLESRAGLDAFDEIIAVRGVQGIMLGPFDLSVSMGHEGDYRNGEVQAALRSMLARAQARGIEVTVPVFSPDLDDARAQLRHWQALGVRRFVIGTDKILIADQFQRTVAALRAG
jgi:4-hydroxy-2-oxoheptanedioate aldolase